MCCNNQNPLQCKVYIVPTFKPVPESTDAYQKTESRKIQFDVNKPDDRLDFKKVCKIPLSLSVSF